MLNPKIKLEGLLPYLNELAYIYHPAAMGSNP